MYSFKLLGIVILALSCSKITAWEWGGDIVFEDNFDGNTLDLTKWEYEESCGAEFGPGNLQCYTRNNVAVRNGNLVITARPERMEDKNYTSGRIRQKGNGFNYGAYVTQARLARGDHIWPAIWLLDEADLCRYEEIDIAEYRGQPSEAYKLDMTGHWGRAYNVLTSKGELATTPFDFSQDFHEFAVLWTPSKIEWYIDRVQYFNVSLTDGTFNGDSSKLPCRGTDQPFTEPTNFILNVAVGGSFFSSFPPMDPATWTKPSMEVDWVRIYQE